MTEIGVIAERDGAHGSEAASNGRGAGRPR